MGFQIVPYSREHQEQVGELIISIQRQEYSIPITLEEQPDLFDVDNFYRHGRGDFWVALNERKVIGTIAVKDIGANQGALRKMFVHRDYRGGDKGVAVGLLRHLLYEAQQRGFKQIYLGTTDAFKAAHRFYEKSGFTEIRENDLPVLFPRMKQDTKFYRIIL
jgi:N-acetylglutamate synthase-like GNAT family acetyltransferase